MKKEVVEKIIKKAKGQKLTLVLDILTSHGGYSSGDQRLVLDLNEQKIKCYENYIEIQNLMYTKYKSHFRMDAGDDNPISELIIEYDLIKAIGL